MKRKLSVLSATALAAALTMVAVGVVPVTATEGCTPGYWKQDHHEDSWPEPPNPGDDFGTTFGITYWDPDLTLKEVLWLGGDKSGINQFSRQAVAALLNAYTFGDRFTVSPETVKIWVFNIDRTSPKSNIIGYKNTFDRDNNSGCPLN